MATDAQHTSESALLRLPAELRLQIYAYVFTCPEPLSVYCWRRYAPFGFATRLLQHPRHFLALLSTTRLIHTETHLLLFHLNTFLFKSSDAFIPWFSRFTPSQLMAVRKVQLVTWMSRHMLEGEAWVPKRVEEVFPIDMLGGLRRVVVEVRGNGKVGDCVRGECWTCEGDGKGRRVGEEEGRLEAWFRGEGKRGLRIEFVRVPA